MQAIVYNTYGPPSVLSLQQIERPVIGERDVLVRVRAASVNSWDRGNLTPAFANRSMLGWLRPKIRVLGGDIAGTIEAVGSAVTRWKPGDAVFGDLSHCGWGAFAEYARATEDALAAKPGELSFAEAAAMPQSAVIALQGIRDYGNVQAGQRVLINGAGGGVGSFAVQLAKLYGAEVTGVDSAPKLGMLRGLGADHVIDYHAQDYTSGDVRYHFVLDCELHRSPRDCLRVLTPHGRLTVVGGDGKRILQAFLMGLTGRYLTRRAGPQLDVLLHKANKNLAELAALAAKGSIHSAIGREYALRDTPLALQEMCDGQVIGKAVIIVS